MSSFFRLAGSPVDVEGYRDRRWRIRWVVEVVPLVREVVAEAERLLGEESGRAS
jgi:hypothetical protein